MDLNFTAEELEFRAHIRQWVSEHLPKDISHKVHHALRLSREDMQRWAKILGAKGWLGWNWPVEFGGPGWNAVQRHLFEEECALAGAPRVVHLVGDVLGQVAGHPLPDVGAELQFLGREIQVHGVSSPGCGCAGMPAQGRSAVRQSPRF